MDPEFVRELQRRDRPVEGENGLQIIFNQESLWLTDAYAQGKETRWMSFCRDWTVTLLRHARCRSVDADAGPRQDKARGGCWCR